jgi:hypothetical protein
MKFGIRKPSLRGFGWLTNPKKALYNRLYYRLTIGLFDLLRGKR